MNALIVLGFISAILYGILIDGTFFKIYFTLVFLYTVFFNYIFVRRSDLTKRKNITAVTWSGKLLNIHRFSEPTDPTSYLVIDFDVSKTVQYIKKIK